MNKTSKKNPLPLTHEQWLKSQVKIIHIMQFIYKRALQTCTTPSLPFLNLLHKHRTRGASSPAKHKNNGKKHLQLAHHQACHTNHHVPITLRLALATTHPKHTETPYRPYRPCPTTLQQWIGEIKKLAKNACIKARKISTLQTTKKSKKAIRKNGTMLDTKPQKHPPTNLQPPKLCIARLP